MESQPQSPEFRNNPENFHPCGYRYIPESIFPKAQICLLDGHYYVQIYKKTKSEMKDEGRKISNYDKHR